MLLGEAVPLKHSISVPSSVGDAVPLSVDVKEVASITPNPVTVVAVRTGPHVDTAAEACTRAHPLLPSSTLQVVCPFLSPVTVHLKVKVSSGQVGGAPVNCPATSPGEKIHKLHAVFQVQNLMSKSYSIELP